MASALTGFPGIQVAGFTECPVSQNTEPPDTGARRGTVVRVAPVAQGIEHFSPKEGVVRSNRIRGTLKTQA